MVKSKWSPFKYQTGSPMNLKEIISLIKSDEDYYQSEGYNLESPKDILEIMEAIDGFSNIEVPEATLKMIKDAIDDG